MRGAIPYWYVLDFCIRKGARQIRRPKFLHLDRRFTAVGIIAVATLHKTEFIFTLNGKPLSASPILVEHLGTQRPMMLNPALGLTFRGMFSVLAKNPDATFGDRTNRIQVSLMGMIQ